VASAAPYLQSPSQPFEYGALRLYQITKSYNFVTEACAFERPLSAAVLEFMHTLQELFFSRLL